MWLGTQEQPGRLEKDCRRWTDRALRERGVWCEGFDGLTGLEIDGRVRAAEGMGVREERVVKGRGGRKRVARKGSVKEVGEE